MKWLGKGVVWGKGDYVIHEAIDLLSIIIDIALRYIQDNTED
jgi:hypothetical protein